MPWLPLPLALLWGWWNVGTWFAMSTPALPMLFGSSDPGSAAPLVLCTLRTDPVQTPCLLPLCSVAFMTTPGSHNDTYAESFHRDFFKSEHAACGENDGITGCFVNCIAAL